MPPARPEAPHRRQNQPIDLLWVVVILFSLFSLICIAMIIAVTTITITTAGSTMPCICPTPTATSAAIATPSDVVAVGAPPGVVATSGGVVTLPGLGALAPAEQPLCLLGAWTIGRMMSVFWALVPSHLSCCGLGRFSSSSGDYDNLRLYINKRK
ncbi:hypothetical protein V8C40DRAFT_38338 [Trichoderma camerunense]